jgi:hypothetical protein
MGGSVIQVSSNLVELQRVLYLLFSPEPRKATKCLFAYQDNFCHTTVTAGSEASP